ncbi:MAG: phage late control D family protein [Novosphingobium sp.]|nr:phage late control D family protein [Novosphingobium sp.]
MATAPPDAQAQARANIADFRLSVDGQDFSDKAKPRLVSLTLTDERAGEADQLDIVLDDSDGKLALPKKGAQITLQLGWKQGMDVTPGLIDKGKFTVDQVDWGGPADQVTIRARSADLTGSFRKRREDKHKDTTLGDLARKVAGRNGLTAKVSPELEDIEIKVLSQHQKSDMALLRQLGREHDAVATVKDGKLLLTPIGKSQSAGGKALPTLELAKAQLAGYRYNETERSGEAGVEARWHDQASGTRKTVTIGGGSDAKGKPRRMRRVYHTEAKARAAAEAEAKRAKRAEATLDLTLGLGRPDLIPEQPVKVSGLKSTIDEQSWLIASLTHTLDSSGLATRIKLEVKG